MNLSVKMLECKIFCRCRVACRGPGTPYERCCLVSTIAPPALPPFFQAVSLVSIVCREYWATLEEEIIT